jgi:hypothetical protein
MREDFTAGARAGAQCAFHQACPGSGGVLAGEVNPAQGRGDDHTRPPTQSRASRITTS